MSPVKGGVCVSIANLEAYYTHTHTSIRCLCLGVRPFATLIAAAALNAFAVDTLATHPLAFRRQQQQQQQLVISVVIKLSLMR